MWEGLASLPLVSNSLLLHRMISENSFDGRMSETTNNTSTSSMLISRELKTYLCKVPRLLSGDCRLAAQAPGWETALLVLLPLFYKTKSAQVCAPPVRLYRAPHPVKAQSGRPTGWAASDLLLPTWDISAIRNQDQVPAVNSVLSPARPYLPSHQHSQLGWITGTTLDGNLHEHSTQPSSLFWYWSGPRHASVDALGNHRPPVGGWGGSAVGVWCFVITMMLVTETAQQ